MQYIHCERKNGTALSPYYSATNKECLRKRQVIFRCVKSALSIPSAVYCLKFSLKLANISKSYEENNTPFPFTVYRLIIRDLRIGNLRWNRISNRIGGQSFNNNNNNNNSISIPPLVVTSEAVAEPVRSRKSAIVGQVKQMSL